MSDKASISYPVTVDIVGSNIPIPSVIAEDPLFQQPASDVAFTPSNPNDYFGE
jgi:hypothetical protein